MASATQFAPAPPQTDSVIGESQRLFAATAEAKIEELMATGQVQPYTIINWNPVGIDLAGSLKQYRIPSAYDDRLPGDVMRGSIQWEGVERKYHALTIRSPKKDWRIVDAKPHDGNMSHPITQREVVPRLPKEIAYSFLERFSPVFVAAGMPGIVQPATPRDARRIYGVLAFEGDIHSLERVLDEQDEEKRNIVVPICHMTTVGKSSFRTFRTVEYSLDKYLEQMFAGQRRYADAVITRAQQKFASGLDEEIKDISDSDRVWYRWAIALGYAVKPKSGEKSWLTEYMTLRGPEETKATANLRKCPGCRTQEPEADTPFCPKCNRPMDTFKTFMAGHPVPEAFLHTLDGEEREIVIAELKRRREGFEAAPASASAETTARGPYKGKGGGKGKGEKAADPATEEIAAAETTALPGEE